MAAAQTPSRQRTQEASGGMVSLGEQDDGRRVTVQVGDTVEVRLPENATTGYRWAPDAVDEDRLQPLAADAAYPANGQTGSGGYAVFRYRVRKAGEARLTLKYWRHFEGAGSEIRRFATTLEAR
jgi:inhibitor of cysteine peptidase